jgi:hypothetical protein
MAPPLTPLRSALLGVQVGEVEDEDGVPPVPPVSGRWMSPCELWWNSSVSTPI